MQSDRSQRTGKEWLTTLPSRLCVAVAAPTVAEMEARSAALLEANPLQELRLDYLADPSGSIEALGRYVRSHPTATFLATCRPQRSGGLLQGSPEDEFQVLRKAASVGFAMVDLSLESAEALGAGAVAELREAGAHVLVSFHDFSGTGDLEAVLNQMRRLHPDLCKIVPSAQHLGDSLKVLELLRRVRTEDPPAVVALAMGDAGQLSRLLGLQAGSAFTFAAADDREATAPGQITAAAMRETYGVETLGPETLFFGVAGDPIHSSLSPLMLNAAFRESGLAAVGLPLKTASAPELLRVANALPLAGCGVTMPLKQSVLPLLQTVDPLAARIGAVNTLRRQADGGYEGFNTDVAGIVVPLEQRRSLLGARVLVLGAGGAARAAVFGCRDRGAEVAILNRSRDTAEQLAQEAGASVIGRADLGERDFDVLIHATPAGMRHSPEACPVRAEELRADIVFDLVYNPLETPLLRLAREQGRQTIAGVEMFVHQGARQFELWTGQPAPVHRMRAVVLAALNHR